MKKAVIVGCNGQDGKVLNKYLLEKEYIIVGIDREFISCSDNLSCNSVDIINSKDVYDLISNFQPDEVYYLAAFHHSSEDATIENNTLLQKSYDVQVRGFANFLEGIRQYSPQTRIFYAASSHIFGKPESELQDENTAINPTNIYGITKAAGLFMCRLYRSSYSVFASAGILYNHESLFREEKFISKKIINSAVKIKNKSQEKIVIGNLKHEADWGYAPDYVRAMHAMLNIEKADDFIVATGKKHSVLDFIKIAFGYLDLDWQLYVEENNLIISKDNNCLVGNSQKLREVTGWQPSVDFKEMIQKMIDETTLAEEV
ncbi:MAG: NAD-dependent epimerase/dehydratase family protein [PVC group bacterium]|nr:NAD-dependent epimerase/dehydratase family protein [PVC group bacterium]